MKRFSTLLIVFALVLGTSQCKKNNIEKNINETGNPAVNLQQGPDIERILKFHKDVVAAYEELVTMASENYHASALSNKGYICMAPVINQQNGNEAEIRLTGVFGEKTPTTNTSLYSHIRTCLLYPCKYKFETNRIVK